MAMTWSVSDVTGDLEIAGGSLVRVVGVAEIRQRVLVTLRHHWQEYFLNVPGGVPWYELILGSKDTSAVELLLRRVVLDVPGVARLVSFSLLWRRTVPRALDIQFTIETAAGDVISGALSSNELRNQ